MQYFVINLTGDKDAEKQNKTTNHCFLLLKEKKYCHLKFKAVKNNRICSISS